MMNHADTAVAADAATVLTTAPIAFTAQDLRINFGFILSFMNSPNVLSSVVAVVFVVVFVVFFFIIILSSHNAMWNSLGSSKT